MNIFSPLVVLFMCMVAVESLPYDIEKDEIQELARELAESLRGEETMDNSYSPPYVEDERRAKFEYEKSDVDQAYDPPYTGLKDTITGEERHARIESNEDNEMKEIARALLESLREKEALGHAYDPPYEEEERYANIETDEEDIKLANDPPYAGLKDTITEGERHANIDFDEEVVMQADGQPYTDVAIDIKEDERGANELFDEIARDLEQTTNENDYELAREVADQYMKERDNEAENVHTAAGALRAFNRPGKRTKQISEQIERNNAELDTLMILASNKDPSLTRKLHGIDLTARKAENDPTCEKRINCREKANLNFVGSAEFRTIDGSCNNLNNFTWGMAGTQHRRLLPDAYENGKWNIRKFSVTGSGRKKVDLPSARLVSNTVHSTTGSKPDNDAGHSIAMFYFMQFLDHDLAKTPEGDAKADCCKGRSGGFCMPIIVDGPDDHFRNNYCMNSRRSFTLFRCNDDSKFQNQINELTAFIDASMVYGSSEEEEASLRQFTAGYMKESTREFMPNASHPEEFGCRVTPPEVCYEAGDTRANVHAGLTTYHTLFIRQHNSIAQIFGEIRPEWTDERIYQETRKIIGAQIQHIVYNELLPVLFADTELSKFRVNTPYTYDDSVDPSMTQAFSMAFRYHHLMPDSLHLAKPFGNTVKEFEEINQEKVFLKPQFLSARNFKGIDDVALGMVVSSCPYVNSLMNKAARDLLFLDANGNSFDLVALNIMRGREWGMPSYTEYRALCDLGTATTWEDISDTTSQEEIAKMKSVYKDVRDVDLWTGLVTEKTLPGSITGPTQTCLLAKHFSNIKHGDRFWYERSDVFTESQLKEIKKKSTLARILCDNLDVSTMNSNVFDTNSEWRSCSSIVASTGKAFDLSSWPE